ncbi:MAG: 50S ribosomal protein L1 [Candidatus Babeliales bacterium]
MHEKKNKASGDMLKNNQYPVKDALVKVKELAPAKFDESIDVDINLGIDPAKGEQVVRGSVILPHRVGKEIKVLVFAKGDYADKASKAGADYIGAEDLVEKIQNGWMDFDVAVATPDLMGLVSKLAKKLGPKGLLPNKKLGTVTFDVDAVVADLKRGRRFFRNDKTGLIHFSIGKESFEVDKLHENLHAFIKALMAVKPPAAKGKFLKKVTLSSTMGPGIQINPDEIIS